MAARSGSAATALGWSMASAGLLMIWAAATNRSILCELGSVMSGQARDCKFAAGGTPPAATTTTPSATTPPATGGGGFFHAS